MLLYIASAAYAEGYNRSDFNFHSYKPDTSIGFCTNQSCDFINIDHVVSLKDAYDSGGASWSAIKKESFANDRSNYVPPCGSVNSFKGSAVPSDFLRGSNDGKGLEYKIVRFCEYVEKYYAVKQRYGLSLRGNSENTFQGVTNGSMNCNLAWRHSNKTLGMHVKGLSSLKKIITDQKYDLGKKSTTLRLVD